MAKEPEQPGQHLPVGALLVNFLHQEAWKPSEVQAFRAPGGVRMGGDADFGRKMTPFHRTASFLDISCKLKVAHLGSDVFLYTFSLWFNVFI